MPSSDPLRKFFGQNFEKACNPLSPTWNDLKQAQLLVTGGTGFFGSWLLRLFDWANEALGCQLRVTILSRDPEAFLRRRPEFKELPFLTLIKGNILDFDYPKDRFTHIIHAATDASEQLNQNNPSLMMQTITEGTRRILEFARLTGIEKVLFVSSGAVYGKQPASLTHVPEGFAGAPSGQDTRSAYGEGKQRAELCCSDYGQKHQINVKIARCFAFAGPYLPWDAHFAFGNFIRDSLLKDAIQIEGDGTPLRSYLYGADLAFWLLSILTQGERGFPFHVGSEDAHSILDLAQGIADTVADMGYKKPEIQVAKKAHPDQLVERYVPKTEETRRRLGLKENFSLRESIEQTLLWQKLQKEIV